MEVERRGRLICDLFCASNQALPGRRRVSKSEPKDKSFQISKGLVWEAYKRVKANKGSAGVDGQYIEAFETDLKNNLYVIWNRMSSGTYFPPPVRAVEIPKHGGGTRSLGFLLWPTESLRRWFRCSCCHVRNRFSMMIRTGIGRSGRRWMRWRSAASDAGRGTGYWIWMSPSSSIRLTMILWSRR